MISVIFESKYPKEETMVAGVLITTDPARTKAVYEEIESIEGVANITAVFGRFDLVVMIRALDLDAGTKTIAKIRNVKGVTATETLIATTL
jgi:nitrate reductase NapAB chaperone NapD